jgi:hypothetical protein
MWPGDQQSGGQQYPQGNPPQPPQYPQQPPQPGPQQPQQQPPQQPQQPGPYGQPPNPYAQPGYQQPAYPQQPQQPQQPGGQPPSPQSPYQQPAQPYGAPASPYAQPGYPQQGAAPGYPGPQQYGVPGGPPPGKDGRRKLTIGIAVTAAIAVVAAIAVGAVYVAGGGKKDDAKGKTTPTATAPKSPTATATPSTGDTGATAPDDGDNPRGAPGSLDVKPVIPGWQVVRRGERNVAFDVPPDWTVDKEGESIGFTDKSGKPEVVMGAPAYYKHEWCDPGNGSTADRAAVGTKGGTGAKSLRQAAENEAEAWAYWGYQDNGKGTFSKAQDSKAFHNSHGITGWQAQATATHLPKSNKCSPPSGIAYTVAWEDPAQKTPTPVVWVLYADTGVPDQLAQSIVDKIKSSIRPLKQ